MLYCEPAKKRNITKVEAVEGGILLYSEAGLHRLVAVDEKIIRVSFTARENFTDREKPGIVKKDVFTGFTYGEQEDKITFSTQAVTVSVQRETGSFSYLNGKGKLYVKERDRDSKSLEEFTSMVPLEEGEVRTEVIQTADGAKEVVREAAKVPGEKFFSTRLYLDFQEAEAIYGLGQNEEELLNLRGQTVYVHQANRKIAVPLMVSSQNYGILVNTCSPMIYNDTVNGTYLYTEADDEMDFFFLAGESMEDVNRLYRVLTGKAAMLPKWAFGYMQSQERYETAEEIVAVAKEHRDRNIGLDCIVLDWCSWEDGQWGQKSFDPKRFPNPTEMIQKLHEMDVHFMISIWPNMGKGTANNEEMAREKGLLFASDLYNALDPHAREIYWKQVKEKLFCHGVDAWWCDSSEPITIEWMHKERMEPSVLFAEYCRELQNRIPVWALNAYPFYHAQTLYEGQRKETEEKRVCNLTRSAYTGQQRFGTILWSGDTSASWETLKSQIAAGLNFVAGGFPYWTVDIGAFFVKHSNYWYWDGHFDDTNMDEGYLELFTRWYQWGAFLPVFRGHGTDVRRELWYYDGCDGMFMKACEKVNQVRYQLMPYIYSQAGKVWLKDEMFMKPLPFAFPGDEKCKDIKDQYMFGDQIMVCPVTAPMYYEENHKVLQGVQKTRSVYFPQGENFYDFWTGEYYEGGKFATVPADIDRIPVFVKEGSILPTLPVADRVNNLSPEKEREEIVYKVYGGKDAAYELYQDAGDGYGYEKGEYELSLVKWSEADRTLTVNGQPESKVEVVERK